MNIQSVILHYLVFLLPNVSILYTIAGGRLRNHFKTSAKGKVSFFSLFMFTTACYFMGYFLALMSSDPGLYLVLRAVNYFGVIFLPSTGILFVLEFMKKQVAGSFKWTLLLTSLLLWLLYITNSFHHLVYRKIGMVRINGFSIAVTQKNFGYYLILLFLVSFLLVSMILLWQGMKKVSSKRQVRNYRQLLISLQSSWIAVLVILLGFDRYFDPGVVVIFYVSSTVVFIAVRYDFFDLEVSRWKKSVASIDDVAFLVDEEGTIIAENEQANDCLDKALMSPFLNSSEIGMKKIQIKVGQIKKFYIMNPVLFSQKNQLRSIVFKDVTKRYQAEAALKESEEKYRLLVTQLSQGLLVLKVLSTGNEAEKKLVCIEVNSRFEELTNLDRHQLLDKMTGQLSEFAAVTKNVFIVAQTGQQCEMEFYSERLGRYFDLFFFSPRKNECAIIVTDISQRKNFEEKILYLSYRDHLTGLYNRRYYEEKLVLLDRPDNLPLTIIMADVNGLKLINDSLGHLMGDELLKMSAQIMNRFSGDRSFAARLGGDEFVLVLPGTDEDGGKKLISKLKNECIEQHSLSYELSISFGSATKIKEDEDVHEIYKRAENEMYEHKLYESASVKNKTIHLIMNMLYEKSSREMIHARQVSELCVLIAKKMNLDQTEVNQLRVAGLMHDIGKMSVDETVLNKKGKLTVEEMEAIQRHPEVGFRILKASEEFRQLSRFVLEHHERWDGRGYPRKLKKTEISLPARIVGLADAYDAMTSDRSYCWGLNQQEAIEEIKMGSGGQFDPELVEIFLNQVLPEYRV